MFKSKFAASAACSVMSVSLLSGCNSTQTQTSTNGNLPAANNSTVSSAIPSPALTPTPPANVNSTDDAAVAAREGKRKKPGDNEKQPAETKPVIGSGANDYWLWTTLRAAIDRTEGVNAVKVIVEVQNSVVTLTGTIADATQRAKVEQIAGSLQGVKSVRNQIRISGAK